MSTERDDPLMDSCLEEVLGGIRPPDLRARIVRAWAIRQQDLARAADGSIIPAVGANVLELPEVDPPSIAPQPQLPMAAPYSGAPLTGAPLTASPSPAIPSIPAGWGVFPSAAAQPIAVPLPAGEIAAPPIAAPPPAAPQQPYAGESGDGGGFSIRPASQRDRGEMPWWTVVVALSMLAAGALVGVLAGRNWGPPIAKDPNPATNPNSVAGPNIAEKVVPEASPNKRPTNPIVVQPPVKKPAPVEMPAWPEKNPFDDDPQKNATVVKGSEKPPVVAISRNPLPDAEVVAALNTWLSVGWKQKGIEPAPLVRDEEWLARTFHNVLGRDPSTQEKAQFLASRSATRRTELVGRILTDNKYTDDFARHWAGYWTRVLLGPDDGRSSIANRNGMEDYLRQSIRGGKPMADIANELLSASGSGRPGSPGYNGAANFLLASCGDTFQSEAAAAERTARGLLGIRLDCARCHAHSDGKFSQDQFWQFAACFGPLKAEKVGSDYRLITGSPEELGWETPDGESRSSMPKFVDGSVPAAEGKGRFGQLVGRSDQFAKAVVNRVWSRFTGFGIVNPVDDFGPHNPPSHPELLDTLAVQFSAHGHDLKSLVRWVALSDAVNRGDRDFIRNEPDLPEVGTAPLFSRRYERPRDLKPLDVTLVEMSRSTDKKFDNVGKQIQDLFPRRWGPKPDPLQIVDTSVAPTLPKSVEAAAKAWVGRIMASELTEPERIEHVFLAGLGRKPTSKELTAARQLLDSRGDDAAAGLEQLWWTVRLSSARGE